MLDVSTKIIRIFEKIFSIENEQLSRSIRNEPTWSLLPLKYEHNRQGSASPGTSTCFTKLFHNFTEPIIAIVQVMKNGEFMNMLIMGQ